MEAGDSKIWIWAVFLLISLVYNAWKKKTKKERESNNSLPEGKETGSFGLEDLISQFEDQYGKESADSVPKQMETVPEAIVPPVVVSEKPLKEPIVEVKRSVKSVPTPKAKASSKDKLYSLSNGNREELDENEVVLDLRQMIISQTILERPNY